jgi:hypothetical protein
MAKAGHRVGWYQSGGFVGDCFLDGFEVFELVDLTVLQRQVLLSNSAQQRPSEATATSGRREAGGTHTYGSHLEC